MMTSPATTTFLSDDQLLTALRDHHQNFTRQKAIFLLTLGEFIDRDLAGGQAAPNTATWLMRELGVSRRTAHEYLSIALKLREFSQLLKYFESGQLSYSKVRLLLRYLTEEKENELVALGLELAYPELEQALAADHDPVNGSGKNAREFFKVIVCRETGDVKIWGRFKPDRGAEFLAALKIGELASLRDVAEVQAQTAKRIDQLELDELDGLIDHATQQPERVPARKIEPAGESVEAGPPAPGETNDKNVEEPAPLRSRFGPPFQRSLLQSLSTVVAMVRSTPRSRVRAPGAEVHLRVSLDGMPRVMGHEGAELRQLHRILLNAHSQVEAVDERGVPVFVGRRHRTVNPVQEGVLLEQWGGQCASPGCVRVHFLEFHHIVPWAAGGGTDLDNLIPLCSGCHSLVSAGILVIRVGELDPSKIEFLYPDGQLYVSQRRGMPVRAGRASSQVDLLCGDSFDDDELIEQD